ncbi:GMC oxidoreductase [Chitinibacter sp. ZOR0017]|uniref:GMC oxidoreductase n=1 Tax=Chitinibacter sp. ZOR0017 TaxID=1339254 RepID=UPI0009DCE11E|nr:GMC family oxidoreductase [Chitinibacter sp. ZOR0017]
MRNDFDVVIVGSGITGGWAAKEFCEKGFKVLVIEQGKDLSDEGQVCHAPPLSEHIRKEEYFIQEKSYMFNEKSAHIFNNDKENGYFFDENKPFDWIRTDVLGGRSNLWGGGCYRWSDLDFTANKLDSNGIDWPIRYKDLEPWYSYVEKFVGVSGNAEGLAHAPDSVFLPAMQLSKIEKHILKSIKSSFADRTLTIGRVGVLTKDHMGRKKYSGSNMLVHDTDALFKSTNSTLVAAKSTGNLTVLTNSRALKFEYDDNSERISSVEIINTKTYSKQKIFARIFFLCASTISSTAILLNSRCSSFPNGLANRSGVLGHYLMDHFGIISAVGMNSSFSHRGSNNHNKNRPTISHIPRFKNVSKQSSDFLRGYGFILWEGGVEYSHAQAGCLPSDQVFSSACQVSIMGFGECLPRYDNYIALNFDKTDRFGFPEIMVNFQFGVNEELIAQDMAKEAKSILEISGFESITTSAKLPNGGAAVHEMGTARMGDDPASSVLNKYNQSHDIRNLFITDGACMTSSSNIHPTLTYMALTARACDYAVCLMNSRHL